jgi:heme exporter protein C
VTTHVSGSDAAAPGPIAATGPIGTGSGGSRALGAVVLAMLALVGLLAFVSSPEDVFQGHYVRLMYVHVPVVTAAYAGIVVTTVGSVMVLWKRSQWWDLVAASSAELSALFTALTLATGSIWGRATWGTWWEWDARLTSTAMLFLLLLGYAAIRRTATDLGVRARRSAVVGLLLLPNVLIVNRSVEWWRSLHQDATLFRLDPTIEGLQLFTLVFAIFTAITLFAWLLVHRFRVAWLQDQVDEYGLLEAIDQRRAEAG